MDARLADRLEDCLDRLSKGSSVEDCLASYPEDAGELEPLLRTSSMAMGMLTSQPVPAEVRTRVRARVMAEWGRTSVGKRRSFLGWLVPPAFPRMATAAVVLLLVVIMGGFGTVTASANSLPGDALYPVKQFREEARTWFARSPEAQVAAYSGLVKERVEELQILVSEGRIGDSSLAVSRLVGHLDHVRRVADLAATRDGELAQPLAEAATIQQDAARAIEATLGTAPEDARVDLQRALETIQSATDRVDAAIDALKDAAQPQ